MSEGSTVDPAASAPEHSPAEDGEPPSNGDANDSANYGIDKLHRNSSVDVFRTCADPGRKASLKSLEIPMEHLLSGIIILPGGRDHEGCPILQLTQPKSLKEGMLREITQDGIVDMLIYFTTVPREEARARGFCVIMDGTVMQDFLQTTMVKALNKMQADMGHVHSLLYVSSSAMPDWSVQCGETITLPLEHVAEYEGLLERADKSQLMPDLGGYLEYDHRDWVRFRMQVEPFLCDCVSISKRLVQAIEPLSRDIQQPKSLEETHKVLKKHQLKKRRTFDELHISELATEGLKINKLMKQESEERRSSIQSNPDFLSTITTVQRLISNIEAVKERLEGMWSARGERLEATFKQQTFEKEANQIIEWFEEYTDTHTELEESQQVAETLAKELTDFEISIQQILVRTDKVLQSGTILETLKHTDHSIIHTLMGKIKQLMTDFDDRLGKRKKKIDESVQLHKLTEMSLDWCIESAGLLSEFDLLSSSQDFDPAAALVDIDRFLDENPPPSAENQQALIDLAETSENLWGKQNALFAHNRVMEVSERFSYHSQILENMVATRDKTKQHGGTGLAKVPVASGASVAREERGELPEDSMNGEPFANRRNGMVGERSRSLSPSLSDDLEETDEGAAKSFRSLRKDKIETQKSMHMSTELLDLDEALSFLQEVAHNPEGVKVKRSLSPLEKWKSSPTASPEPKRISKHDISSPTQTMGALFNLPDIESPDDSEIRRFSLPNVTDEDIATQTKNAKHRRHLMQELIDTERTYINDLEFVVENFMPAMENLDDLPRNIVGKKNIIFSNLQQLLEFNRQMILPQLEKCRKCPIKLGVIFVEQEDDILNYSKYFKNMPHQTKLMEEGGTEFFAVVQRRLKKCFDLSSYLIKPFQRITRYKLFLADMIKHSSKTDYKGKMKEYFDQLKESHKMIDFVLRHGNDLLAVESLKGFEGSLREQGKILRQGNLVVYEKHHKHKRRVFLFENTLILAKTKKPKNHPDIAGSEIFEFRSAYKTCDFTLYESVASHQTRFELRKRKESLIFQAETVEERTSWTQDVWDLYFSHMLHLKDQNLEAYGSRALTSVVTSGMATLTRGRPLGHSMRRSLRYSAGTLRSSRPRPPSQISITSTGDEDTGVILRPRAGTYSPTPSTNRLSGTFIELRSNRMSACSLDEYSDRSSLSSSSTLTSLNMGGEVLSPQPLQKEQHSPVVSSPLPSTKRQSQLTLAVHRASRTEEPRSVTPEVTILDANSSSTSSQDISDDTPILGESENTPIFDTPV